jgi:alkanesulfonate monooxygenase SsuD/methylene tetrahydromethanopterin reductase-like flavin-dependent oxidoreductase (luciferase family)
MFPKRTLDKTIVVGDAAEMVRRVREYETAGIAKFILRPIGDGDEDLYEQTRRLIETVIPEVHGRAVAKAAE